MSVSKMGSEPCATGYARSGATDPAVRIFYRRFGEPGATPVLIVHGLSFFSWDWIGPAARLPSDRQVAARTGFGLMPESAQDKAAPGNR